MLLVSIVTFLDTVLGAIGFLSCMLRTIISVSPFSSLPVSPWPVFCGLLEGGWRRKLKHSKEQNCIKEEANYDHSKSFLIIS